MNRRKTFALLVVVGAAAATAVVAWVVREKPLEEAWSGVWQPREIQGVVRAGGEPVPKATVDCYESPGDGRPGDVTRVVADDAGRFRFRWQPRFGEVLHVRARDPGNRWAATVAEASADETVVDLAPRARSKGRVLTFLGEPVAGAQVAVAARHGLEAKSATTGADGVFSFDGLPEGRALDLVVGGPGLVPSLETRFVGGDEMVLRAFPGTRLRIEVRGPGAPGNPVEGFKVRPVLPAALQSHAPPVFASPSGDLVHVEAPGYLPVQAEVVAHRATRVILWPKRTVTLRLRDSVRKRGVPRATFDIEIRPEKNVGHWSVGLVGSALRRFPVRRGPKGGEYIIDLPVCPLWARAAAPGYADTELTLLSETPSRDVWLRPLPRRLGGTLLFLSPQAPAGFPIVVVDSAGRWHRTLRIVRGRARIEVPPGGLVQVGSLGARDGFWLPRVDIDAPRRGETKRIPLQLHPASRLTLETTPPVDGSATLTDVSLEKFGAVQRAPLENGKAVLWARPKREARVEAVPDSNHFPVRFTTIAEDAPKNWPVDLRPSAGVAYRVVDSAQNPIPFALVRLWEPAHGGRLELRRDPKVLFSGPTGQVSFRGLRAGRAAVEFRADGFRTRLFSLLELKEGELAAGGAIVMKPTGRFSGRVTDQAGKPVAGAWLRVLEPSVRRLPMPNGAERDLYDLTVGGESGDGATDDEGRFDVPDASARAPLIACHPVGRPDLGPAVFEAGESGGPGGPGAELRMNGVAYLELEVPASVRGVYMLLPEGRAVLVAVDPPMSLRPLPVKLPAGPVSLFVRLVTGRWAAPPEFTLKPGETLRLSLDWQDK